MLNLGITGHQNFEGISDTSWLEQELSIRIAELKDIRLGYSSLAIGADVLFAETLLLMEISLIVVIPCKNYDSTFSEFDRNHYHFLLNKSDEQILMDFSDPDDEAFFAAGKYIAEQSDRLFVLWDGKPAKALGGTGDVFEYALKQKTTVVHINPWTRETLIYNKRDLDNC
jgi:uncharacterized phage-like protein YoqJ